MPVLPVLSMRTELRVGGHHSEAEEKPTKSVNPDEMETVENSLCCLPQAFQILGK